MAERAGPASFNEVFLDELTELRPGDPAIAALHAAPAPAPGEGGRPKRRRDVNLRRIFRKVGHMSAEGRGLSALCLSGGGIRSATFNLGVIQGLARAGLVDQFDYLSTVSGGGYIGGWFKAWTRRSGTKQVLEQLTDTEPRNPLAPEPNPVGNLREYSNYLTPRLGLLSPDTWTMAAIISRNLLLNWLVIVPVIAALVMLPQLLLLVSHSPIPVLYQPALLVAALASAAVGSYSVHALRHQKDREGVRRRGSPETRQRRIVAGGVFPLVLSAALLATALSRTDPSQLPGLDLIVFIALWTIWIPLLGWALHEPLWRIRTDGIWPWRDMLALVVSGAVGGGILLLLVARVAPWLVHRPSLYVTLAVPILLAVYLLSRTLYVALTGVGEERDANRVLEKQRAGAAPEAAGPPGGRGDAEREWWARFSGFILMSACGWPIVFGLVLLGWHLSFRLFEELLPPLLTAVGGTAGIAVGILGKSAQTGRSPDGTSGPVSPIKDHLLNLSAPLFIVALIVLVSHVTVEIGRDVTGNPTLFRTTRDLEHLGFRASPGDLAAFAAAAVGLVAFASLMGAAVNVNRFSLNGFYRNRLVRAYLGASNPERDPDPFTGFDPHDNLKLHELWPPDEAEHGGGRRPLPLVNCTLNLVTGQQKLAWQQRKAESFSMTPLYCGNFFEGYRSSKEYGGPGGITLGSALTISGAAANPNAGSHSSPAMTFLMTLFNARLGAWLGNTNVHGERTFRRSGPRWALRPLFSELLGLTNSSFRYVNLSDGGHFDNLGLYEMVLRRCRFVLVSDAGQDPAGGFEDLGNAIRKIRIDFGIPVDFTTKIQIPPREEVPSATYCAVGTIRYRAVDGADAPDGTLIYLKPALHGQGEHIPYDVFSYARTASTFPHESTADQWFSESQFESYRMLGLHAVRQFTRSLAEPTPVARPTLADLATAVSNYVNPAAAAAGQVRVGSIYPPVAAEAGSIRN